MCRWFRSGGNLILSLLAWGFRSEMGKLREEMKTRETRLSGDLQAVKTELTGKMETLKTELSANLATVKAEVRASIAEAGSDFFRQVNGAYVRTGLHEALIDRVHSVEKRFDHVERAIGQSAGD